MKNRLKVYLIGGFSFLLVVACALMIFLKAPPPRPPFVKAKPLPAMDDEKAKAIADLIEQHSHRKEGQPLFTGDSNGDGIADKISFPPVRVCLSTRGGGMDCYTRKALPLLPGNVGFSGPTSVGLDDFNGDGYLEAWVADPADRAMRYFCGNKWGFYFRMSHFTLSKEIRLAAFYDVDEDGDLDIVGRLPENWGQETGIYWMESKLVE